MLSHDTVFWPGTGACKDYFRSPEKVRLVHIWWKFEIMYRLAGELLGEHLGSSR